MTPLSGDPDARAKQIANLRPGARTAEVGNQRARSHGAYARVAVARLDAKTREIFDAIAADAPLRGQGGGLPSHDAAMVRLLAECMIRLDDVAAHLRDRGMLDANDQVRPAVEVEARLRKEAADYLDALGMTPRSRARLGLDLVRTVDAATALSEPDPALRRELLQAAGILSADPPPDAPPVVESEEGE